MAFISIYTIGRLRNPYDHPSSRGFYDMGYKVMRQAYASGHLLEEFSSEGITIPEEANAGGYPVLTLTIWKSLQSLYRFTYGGKHSQALRNRNNWMESHDGNHSSYVIWWTEKVKDVSWEEAFKRYEYYLEHKATPYAFDLKQAFDESGKPSILKS
ncbi:DUF3291 domain-containing protein [Rossellomorea sp. KS-H15a]|uniref:DUF3291 domain-containing protein n=1 Tax=Rossellomorea sp. KS-H15a TaxID=2963940 RepID=UPI0020C6EA9C|nr:DUF3291 domain-containing protein [Rossellomorea sp. KS-H15a]UTE76855.1 DUF3291 domain-containing protein [Rossellomorea sp. KS-H15a]